MSKTGDLLAEAHAVARRAFRHRCRELERDWHGRFGGGWAKALSINDEDYGEAYAFAEACAVQVLARAGVSVDPDSVYWCPDEGVLLE